MNYRHEWKCRITEADCLTLRLRLGALLQRDIHAPKGSYQVRSLYFDNAEDKALREKLDGVNMREKFRIRLYDADTDFIRLEKKSKWNNLGTKESAVLTCDEVQALLGGDYDRMKAHPAPLVQELYEKILHEGLEPKVIVSYQREPFVYPVGNVRVTLDWDIRTGTQLREFLRPDCPTLPLPDSTALLEVKWDDVLPDLVRDAVQLGNMQSTAFSKYAQCRVYG